MNKKIEDKKVTKNVKTDSVKKEKVSEKVSTFKKKKKIKRNITSGIAYVYSTFNNTIISIADESGNVIAWSSAGAKGFKGSRKSTPYAAAWPPGRFCRGMPGRGSQGYCATAAELICHGAAARQGDRHAAARQGDRHAAARQGDRHAAAKQGDNKGDADAAALGTAGPGGARGTVRVWARLPWAHNGSAQARAASSGAAHR